MPDIRARKITPAIQVLVWFAAHPEMAFTAPELIRKFGFPNERMAMAAMLAFSYSKLVTIDRQPDDRRRPVYLAGPALLDLI